MLVLPDHPTPVRVRTHVSDPVPYMLYDSTKEAAGKETYCERTGRETGVVIAEGYRMMDHLLGK